MKKKQVRETKRELLKLLQAAGIAIPNDVLKKYGIERKRGKRNG